MFWGGFWQKVADLKFYSFIMLNSCKQNAPLISDILSWNTFLKLYQDYFSIQEKFLENRNVNVGSFPVCYI